MSKNTDKTLFISALHGDEGFSVDVFKKLEKKYPRGKYKYDRIIGNERAYKKGVRLVNNDLNRIAPGNPKSGDYELKRSSELVSLSKNYSALIDIHGTDADTGIFIIITNPTPENLTLAGCFPVKNVVVWTSDESKETGPLTQFAKCPAIEIECGPKNSKKISDELETVIKEFLERKINSRFEILENIKSQKHFRVVGIVEDLDTSELIEFQKTNINGESFYPLLINSYKKGSVRKMKQIDFYNHFNYQYE